MTTLDLFSSWTNSSIYGYYYLVYFFSPLELLGKNFLLFFDRLPAVLEPPPPSEDDAFARSLEEVRYFFEYSEFEGPGVFSSSILSSVKWYF